MSKFEQVTLNYAMDAFEPVIDTLTMETHYGKHHATYTATFNKLLEEAGAADKFNTIEEVLAGLDQIDEAKRTAIRNNGGGYYNHNLYFCNLAPLSEDVHKPTGKLLEQIDKQFGSVEKLQEELKTLALGQFGSGWAFLSVKKGGELVTSKSPNQDNPISEGTGNTPILGIDVWEHAYYLKYKNLRADYVDKLFSLINWENVGKLYEAGL
ncbi:superoxide dismutase [Butyrivibrio sp.]|uniref:superoxide dismutase n=1 Tax=Butyrivibrio sp. TaxID=28121 RepID=UPI0025B820D0|nr:superoxide dismutase [Butyrivibrio sp.]MBQ9304517.1 superoxide dismutase [Butyrivibrio sp.]